MTSSPVVADGCLELAAFLRTTLPLDLGRLDAIDNGRYHSIWLPDHLVSFWPDAIWTPEFTDLAEVSHSPHRHLDALAVAGGGRGLDPPAAIATSVVDTVRRHPVMLAQSAVTLSHLSGGRFILGPRQRRAENVEPYGFAFVERSPGSRRRSGSSGCSGAPPGRSTSTVTSSGCTTPGSTPSCTTTASADLDGRQRPADAGAGGAPRRRLVADRQRRAGGVRREARHDPPGRKVAGRDPMAIVPAKMVVCLLGGPDELREMLERPLVRSYVLQLTAESLRPGASTTRWAARGAASRTSTHVRCRGTARRTVRPGRSRRHPRLGAARHAEPRWPATSRSSTKPGSGSPSILDYSGMAGQAFAARSADKVRETEDEILRLVGATA